MAKHNLGSFHPMTMPMGQVIPIGVQEVLPGDVFRHSTAGAIQLITQQKPVRHPLRMSVAHYFVPNRFLWDESSVSGNNGWMDFISGGKDGLDDSEHPYISVSSNDPGDLLDYLRIPTGTWGTPYKVNALLVRAYWAICNEFYRNKELSPETDYSTDEGQDTTTPTTLWRANWAKDPFTKARISSEKGLEVTIPLGDSAPIEGFAKTNQSYPSGPSTVYQKDGTTTFQSYDIAAIAIEEDPDNAGYPNVYADLSAITGIPISELRTATGIQRLQERLSKYGDEYTQFLRGYGANLPDYRLNKPDFLGGGSSIIQFSEVLSTAEGTTVNVGDLAGFGQGSLKTNAYRRYFNEFGIMMSVAVCTPYAMYMDAMPRMAFRETRYDYFTPELQYIGDQVIYNKQVQASHTTPDGIFGYGDRYRSYTHTPSTVHGEARSTNKDWHMARDFASAEEGGGDVSLNESFVKCTPTDRIFQDQTGTDPIEVTWRHYLQADRLVKRNPKAILM